MANISVFLSDLQTGRSSYTVQVRLFRLWEARNVRCGEELMGVDILLLDSQDFYGDHLQRRSSQKFINFPEASKISQSVHSHGENQSPEYYAEPIMSDGQRIEALQRTRILRQL
ncbi:hypothetical protein Rs2_28906 [Raphanus sativus]|nr:hypothetical protein Rs2_28906 [Raphanus sativus]